MNRSCPGNDFIGCFRRVWQLYTYAPPANTSIWRWSSNLLQSAGGLLVTDSIFTHFLPQILAADTQRLGSG